ncbi:MAG: type II secretion system protein [Candidatus Paceibacterota bacterium]|jgi:type II secretory pathway pseudopilin PulG
MNKKNQKNRGMSYVELIVVLSIFAALSSVVIFNYGDFQDRVDIKNVASDIALKIVEAQKSSINGVLPPPGYNYDADTWKPAYGVYFDIVNNNKQFIYFADLNGDFIYNESAIDTINITKGNVIEKIENCSDANCTLFPSVSPLSIFFRRPDSSAIFDGAIVASSGYIRISILSPKEATALIKIYPSGRVQVN